MRVNLMRFAVVCLLGAILAPAEPARGDDLAGLEEQAVREAAARVAPSVVQIETSAAVDAAARGRPVRRGAGPTTGLVVGSDGYVVTSAFNFADRPAAVFVALPGHKDRYVARQVATDHVRMLTLLKVDAGGLPVPAAAPKAELRVGQTVAALGRTWTGADAPPSISVGVISALGRVWGKAVQTDAKVSPVNYGGPLVDLRGHVVGILIPASPQGQDETAGVEWYDSGIGFAVPLEDVFAVLPRVKEGKDLRRGLLGFGTKTPDLYGVPPEVARVVPNSAAARAGIKVGDVVSEVDGHRVERQAQVMQALGTKYEGDVVTVKVRRGKEELTFPNLTLGSAAASFARGFLGVSPVRDDPAPGVQVRFIYPKSPAEAAGLKVGDRVVSLAPPSGRTIPIGERDRLLAITDALPPGTEVKLGVKRKDGKDETLTVTLGEAPDDVPGELPERSSLKKAHAHRSGAGAGGLLHELHEAEAPEASPAPPKKVETGLLKRMNAAGDHEYRLYVPANYDAGVSHALVIWLHATGHAADRDAEAVVEAWKSVCESGHVILLLPKAQNETGWLAGEADVVADIARAVAGEYTIDPQRVVAHGAGVGGRLALYLAYRARDLVRGAAAVGATIDATPPETSAGERLAVYLAAAKGDPVAPAVAELRGTLAARHIWVVYREFEPGEEGYLPASMVAELARWLDGLDRV